VYDVRISRLGAGVEPLMVRRAFAIVVGVALGLVAGIGGYTFIYAKGAAYLTNDPKACANCHVMADEYDGWTKSSHHAVAVCNDCHTPHGLGPKYLTKGLNGFWHSYAFTLGGFPDPIQITDRNHRVTEGACRKCHAEITDNIQGTQPEDTLSCVRCHRDVGHLH
jgi:cytochrome c nitrite reductase small subunit